MAETFNQKIRNISNSQVILATLLAYFLIMDVQMYIRVQKYPLKNDAVNSSNYLSNCEEYSPFCWVTAKAILLDHVDLYIFSPLVTVVDLILQISSISFITPNLVTFSHVLIALASGRFVSSPLLTNRRLGALLFEVRTFLDGLDGHIARARKSIHGEKSEVGTSGYYIDGVCDALGIVFFLTGLFLYLRKYTKYNYLPTDSSESHDTCNKYLFNKIFLLRISCVALQLFASSFGWNRYIAEYQNLIDAPKNSRLAEEKALIVMRSFKFQLTALFWRLFNPHAYMHVLLYFVVIDRVQEFLKFVQNFGFPILIALMFWSEVELTQVREFLLEGNSAFNTTLL